MKVLIIVAVVLIVVGVLALVYGQFSYTRDSETATLGPLQLTVRDRETVNIPTWAGAGSVIAGTALLIFALVRR